MATRKDSGYSYGSRSAQESNAQSDNSAYFGEFHDWIPLSQRSGFFAGVNSGVFHLQEARKAALEILEGPTSGQLSPEARLDHEWDLWVLNGVILHDFPVEALVEVRTEMHRVGLASAQITFA